MVAYVGCYTTEKRNGHGKGINVYRMDPASGHWSHVPLVENLVNPSFLALDRRQRFLYAVHGDMTYATAFAIDASSGHLKPLNQQDTGGTNPVHLAVDPSNRFLVVSNYSSGSVAVLPIHADGSLAPRSDVVELQGKPGPHPSQQTRSHPHHNPLVVYPAATDNSNGCNPVKFPYFTLMRRGICHDSQPVILPAPFGFPRLDLYHDPRLVAQLFQSHTGQALQARSTSTSTRQRTQSVHGIPQQTALPSV
jgi:hypothetical protein